MAKETQKKKKNPGGRPTKYKAEYAKQAEKLCLLGATDKELADFFEIDVATLNRWKLRHPKFCASIKDGKEISDNRVERSLYERALGYAHPDTHISNYKGDVTVTPIEKHYPPEVVACIFWLKNRQPDKWRDKVEHGHGDLTADEVDRAFSQAWANIENAQGSTE